MGHRRVRCHGLRSRTMTRSPACLPRSPMPKAVEPRLRSDWESVGPRSIADWLNSIFSLASCIYRISFIPSHRSVSEAVCRFCSRRSFFLTTPHFPVPQASQPNHYRSHGTSCCLMLKQPWSAPLFPVSIELIDYRGSGTPGRSGMKFDLTRGPLRHNRGDWAKR